MPLRWLCLILTACALPLLAARNQAGDDPNTILESARQAVSQQLARAANYACVQTIERDYSTSQQPAPLGCFEPSMFAVEKPWMSDRLRLDIAVSQGREIYSWHAASTFTSSDVAQVVQTGPIASGNFIGITDNIFLQPGICFTFRGKAEQHGSIIYTFDYVVPLELSRYQVQGKAGRSTIPYHGSFSISGSDYQLTRLQVVGDAIPPDSPLCSVETNITYQMVTISGRPSLLPASFVLEISDERHVHSLSTSHYSQCREFRGESTLHFDFADGSAQPAHPESKLSPWLPAGVSLQISLSTPINGRQSYIGDPVRGIIAKAVKLPGRETVIPKGALLEGIITKLEDHQIPFPFQLFSVNFTRLSFGQTSYLLNAWPETSLHDCNQLHRAYGSPLPNSLLEDIRKGLFFARSSHLHLDHHFSATWITAIPPYASLNAAAAQ